MAGGLSAIKTSDIAGSDVDITSKPYDDVLAELRQRMATLDDPGRKSSAFWAAAGQPTRGGSLAESFSNGALSQAQAQREDDKLKAGYMPLMMSAIEASQQAQMQHAALALQRKQMANYNAGLRPQLGMGAGLPQGMLPPQDRIPMGQTGGQLPAVSGAQGGLENMSYPQALAWGRASGLDPKVATELWKVSHEGIIRKPGEVSDFGNGRMSMPIPAVDKNQQLQQDGKGGWRTSVLPGAAQATSEMTAAQELPKAYIQQAGQGNIRKMSDGTERYVPASEENPSLSRLMGAATESGINRPLLGAPQAAPSIPSVGAYQPSAQDRAVIEADAAKNGIQSPFINFTKPNAQPESVQPVAAKQGMGAYGQTDSQRQADVNVGTLNKGFLEKEYPAAIARRESSTATLGQVATMRQAIDSGLVTGWTTPVRATAAAMLSSLGYKDADKLASSAQTFDQAVQQKVYEGLNAATGPQTEGDAKRFTQTLANLGNTPAANQFQLDMAEAMARKDIEKAAFFDKFIPKAGADAYRVAALWREHEKSVWKDPVLQKYVR